MSENAQLRPPHFVRLKENEYPGEASSDYVAPPECDKASYTSILRPHTSSVRPHTLVA
jgi:hypothetical protein